MGKLLLTLLGWTLVSTKDAGMGVVVVSTSLATAGEVGVMVMIGSWAVARGTAAMKPTAATTSRVKVRRIREKVFMEIENKDRGGRGVLLTP